ncbi:NADH-quinone oxidoreductase subunit C [Streptomyces roseifaciens]
MTEPTPESVPEAAPEPAPEPVAEPVADLAVGWLPAGVISLFGEGATAEETYELLTVDVPAERWTTALETARDRLGCTFFDWLSAVDEPGTGFRVCAHLAALPGALPGGGGGVRRLLLRTTVPHEAPALATAVGVYAGAAWHERETHEMFGIDFPGHPHLAPLLLPEAFEGHPLRKDFVLAARVVKAWPGAKEPGEGAEGGPKRRQMLPPGVPDPNEWGPLKGQLPPAPARPARAPRAAGDRPVRRARTAAEGSASQPEAPAAPRRTRSAADGSASQAETPAPRGSASQQGAEPAPRRTRTAADGSASQAEPAAPRRARSASDGSASQAEAGRPADTAEKPRPRSSDAPWHHARPAFEETPKPKPDEPPAVPGSPAGKEAPGAAGEAPGTPEPGGEPRTSPRCDGAQPKHRDPAVPSSPVDESTPGAAEEAPSGLPAATPEPEAEPRTPSRRDGAQPEQRDPAVPGSPADEEAPRAAGTAGTPEPGAAGRGRDGEPENDTNPAGGDPA